MLLIVIIVINSVEGVIFSFLFRILRLVEIRVNGIINFKINRVFCEKGLKMGMSCSIDLREKEEIEVMFLVEKNVDWMSIRKNSEVWRLGRVRGWWLMFLGDGGGGGEVW